MIKKGFSHIGIVFLQLLSYLPLQILFGLSNLMYYLIYYIIKYRKDVVRENLSKSFPEKSPKEIVVIEKKFFRYLCDLMVEVVKMNSISEKEVLNRVKMTNFDQVEEYFKRGESVLGCSAHYGNWELGMLAAGLKISAVATVIYKPLSNKIFEDWFLNLRTKFGNVFVPMRQTLRHVVSTKDQTTLLCFASDQTPKRAEIQYRLEFLNQSTPALLGLEKIALQTNRPVFYFDAKRIKRGYYEVTCIPVSLNPKATKEHEITDLFFENLNNSIQRDPEYWMWSHKRWKANK